MPYSGSTSSTPCLPKISSCSFPSLPPIYHFISHSPSPLSSLTPSSVPSLCFSFLLSVPIVSHFFFVALLPPFLCALYLSLLLSSVFSPLRLSLLLSLGHHSCLCVFSSYFLFLTPFLSLGLSLPFTYIYPCSFHSFLPLALLNLPDFSTCPFFIPSSRVIS